VNLAAPQGFEPRLSAPKADVLPLHHGAKSMPGGERNPPHRALRFALRASVRIRCRSYLCVSLLCALRRSFGFLRDFFRAMTASRGSQPLHKVCHLALLSFRRGNNLGQCFFSICEVTGRFTTRLPYTLSHAACLGCTPWLRLGLRKSPLGGRDVGYIPSSSVPLR
jgi:hypothetical protein